MNIQTILMCELQSDYRVRPQVGTVPELLLFSLTQGGVPFYCPLNRQFILFSRQWKRTLFGEEEEDKTGFVVWLVMYWYYFTWGVFFFLVFEDVWHMSSVVHVYREIVILVSFSSPEVVSDSLFQALLFQT